MILSQLRLLALPFPYWLPARLHHLVHFLQVGQQTAICLACVTANVALEGPLAGVPSLMGEQHGLRLENFLTVLARVERRVVVLLRR